MHNLSFDEMRFLTVIVHAEAIAMNTRILIEFPFWVPFVTPISLRAGDVLTVDPRSCLVELINRQGIFIFRRGWLN